MNIDVDALRKVADGLDEDNFAADARTVRQAVDEIVALRTARDRPAALEEAIAAAVRAAREEMRERCAQVAESQCDDPPSPAAALIRGLPLEPGDMGLEFRAIGVGLRSGRETDPIREPWGPAR